MGGQLLGVTCADVTRPPRLIENKQTNKQTCGCCIQQAARHKRSVVKVDADDCWTPLVYVHVSPGQERRRRRLCHKSTFVSICLLLLLFENMLLHCLVFGFKMQTGDYKRVGAVSAADAVCSTGCESMLVRGPSAAVVDVVVVVVVLFVNAVPLAFNPLNSSRASERVFQLQDSLGFCSGSQ